MAHASFASGEHFSYSDNCLNSKRLPFTFQGAGYTPCANSAAVPHEIAHKTSHMYLQHARTQCKMQQYDIRLRYSHYNFHMTYHSVKKKPNCSELQTKLATSIMLLQRSGINRREAQFLLLYAWVAYVGTHGPSTNCGTEPSDDEVVVRLISCSRF